MVRFALIGTGNMGRKYAQMFHDGLIKDGRLTAVVCRSNEAKKWADDTFAGQVHIFNDSDSLFAHAEEYDAVLIVTPHKTHPQLAVTAFQLGKAVFCDKPAGVSVAQADLMNLASIETGKLYAMMFHQRLYAKYQYIKDMIELGKLGNITRVMMVNSRYYRTEYYHQSGTWRSSWNGEGGGALINQGQHIIDIWQWLFGMPKKIYADVEFGKYNDFLVDDEATITMKYANRMTGLLVLTTGDGGYEERLEISGTKGKLVLEDQKLTIQEYSQDTLEYGKTTKCNSREALSTTQHIVEFPKQEEPYVEMLTNFVHAYQGQADLIAPGVEGKNALEIVNAAYLSAWQNKTIDLPIESSVYEDELRQHMTLENN